MARPGWPGCYWQSDLIDLGLPQMVAAAGYPSSPKTPALSYALALKLASKRRVSPPPADAALTEQDAFGALVISGPSHAYPVRTAINVIAADGLTRWRLRSG